MIFKGILFLLGSIFFICLAIFLYQPLPEGIRERNTVNLILCPVKLLRFVAALAEFFGYGDFNSNAWRIQALEVDREPVTASYGDLKVTKEIISGVPVITYQPKDTSKLHPAIILFHAGGWTILGPDLYDKTAYDCAKRTNSVVFNVGYRLAPQHPFPAALLDCYEVTKFVLKHGAKYNVDVTKVGLTGDSAGGNLAPAVILKLLADDPELPPLLFQALHYPALQALNFQLPSYIEFNNTISLLTTDLMIAFYVYYMGLDVENMKHYVQVMSENKHIPLAIRNSSYVDVNLLPEAYRKETRLPQTLTTDYDEQIYARIKHIVTNPLFSPLLAPDLSSMPPTFIHISEFDVLRDDGFLFAARLQKAGVKVQVHLAKGCIHCSIVKVYSFMDTVCGNESLSAAYKFINDILYD